VTSKHDEAGAAATGASTQVSRRGELLCYSHRKAAGRNRLSGTRYGRLVEFSEGCIEVHDMPTKAHQRIVRFLFQALHAFVSPVRSASCFFAPLPVRLWKEKSRARYRFCCQGRAEYRGYPDGADLVIELPAMTKPVVAAIWRSNATSMPAGIQEYWIVDPHERSITVLYLAGGFIKNRGNSAAASPLLPHHEWFSVAWTTCSANGLALRLDVGSDTLAPYDAVVLLGVGADG